MKKTCKNWKNRNGMILIVALSLLLAGCGSETVTDTTQKEAEAVVNEATTVEETVGEAESVKETTAEESAEELYIPEGIDMNSTLPGEEWIQSFIGKVTEPVVVIYNDNTGRKEVVQAGGEVTVNPDEDIFAVYWNERSMGCTTHAISTNGLIMSDYYEIEIMDSEKMRKIPERDAKVTVMGGAEDWVLEFKITVE